MKSIEIRALRWPFTSKDVDEIMRSLVKGNKAYILQFKLIKHKLKIIEIILCQSWLHFRRIIWRATDQIEFSKLHITEVASFDSYEDEHGSMCHLDIQNDLLNEIKDWTHDSSGKCIFWPNRMAEYRQFNHLANDNTTFFQDWATRPQRFLQTRQSKSWKDGTILQYYCVLVGLCDTRNNTNGNAFDERPYSNFYLGCKKFNWYVYESVQLIDQNFQSLRCPEKVSRISSGLGFEGNSQGCDKSRFICIFKGWTCPD
jgi:hypothetical protein